MGTVRWGILGTGNIARKFVTGLSAVPGAEALAVGSRHRDSAEAFANSFNMPRRYASYEALVNDPDLDVIYVATPHPLHHPNMRMSLQAGKAVLCEKPFTINAEEAADIIALAREKKRFVMEAMWTRFLPAYVKIRELVAEGTIGDVRMVTADFGSRLEFDPKSRIFDLALGGGALLDVGVYPISLASMLLGTPSSMVSQATLGTSGVDELCAMLFHYPQGQMALLSGANRVKTPQEALIAGTEGMIKIPSPWWRAERFTLLVPGKDDQEFYLPLAGNGWNYQAVEVGECLSAGRIESTVMPLDETLAIMQTMDRLRADWGLVYPMESPGQS